LGYTVAAQHSGVIVVCDMSLKPTVAGSALAALVARRSRPAIRRTILIAAAVATWEVVALLVAQPEKLPAPSLVVHAAGPLIQSGELGYDILVSLRRVILGFALATAVGVPVGIAMGISRVIARLAYPAVELLRPIPAIAMLPIFLVTLGVGEALSISIVYFAAVFPIIINTQTGVHQITRIFPEAARTLGAREWQIIPHVILPASLPMIFTGLRIGLQFGWMSIIGAEFIGATTGLGYMIVFYQRFLMTDRVIVGMVAIGVLGFLLDSVLLLVRRIMLPWLPR
jgi:NitT/TauT family transport system permease protein